MSLMNALLATALRSLGSQVSTTLLGHLRDPASRLGKALQQAHEQTWLVVETALAGPSLWQRLLASGEERALVERLQSALLVAVPRLSAEKSGQEFCQRCRVELQDAKRRGLLDPQADWETVVAEVGQLCQYRQPNEVLQAENRLLDRTGERLREEGYEALAWLVSLPLDTSAEVRLLPVLVRYFFRRALERDDELYRQVSFDLLDNLSQQMESALGEVHQGLAVLGERLLAPLQALRAEVVQSRQDILQAIEQVRQGQQQQQHVLQQIHSQVQRLLQLHGNLHQRELRPSDTCSVQNEAERQLIRELMEQVRQLPESVRQRAPELLAQLGKAAVLCGDLDAAVQYFLQAAQMYQQRRDREQQAEAYYNAYRTFLEKSEWNQALAALNEAVRLAPDRFSPFPVHELAPLRILGAGAFGVTFLCQYCHTKAKVAVKVFNTAMLPDPQRVFEEAAAMEQVQHPAIIRIRHYGYVDPRRKLGPYLIMEWFDGQNLSEYVQQNGPIPLAEALPLLRQIAEGLRAAHARNILHRDVKPSNILVRRDGEQWQVRLIDFGLACTVQQIQATMQQAQVRGKTTIGRTILGTWDYSAPEQLGKLGGVQPGFYSDIYAFGRTCCYALFGTPNPTPMQWRRLPDWLAELLDRCLRESPKDRFASFDEFLQVWDTAQQARIAARPDAAPHLAPAAGPLAGGQQARIAVRPDAATAPVTTFPAGQTAQHLGNREVLRLTGHEGWVTSVAVTPDGQYVVSGSRDNTVRLWELATGKEVRRFTGHEWGVRSVAVTPDGQYVVSGSWDNTVRLWDRATGQELRRFTGHDDSAWSVAVTPDGQYVVSGSSDKTVRVWDVATGKEVRRFTGHEGLVLSVAVTPDGKYVVSGSGNETVRVWDLATGKEVRRFTGHERWVNSVAVTPDRKYIVSGSGDRTVRLWELATGKEVQQFTGHQKGVTSVAVTPDGRYVVSGSRDKTVRVWELATGQEVRRFTGHADYVSSVAVTPDGKYVVSGSWDKTVRVWYIGDLM
jgi:WD40 repeat protein/tetratricopeptide (TPR) repeat protein